MALCLIQDSIDYSLFHYIVGDDTPKRWWNILKEVFNEDLVVEVESHAKHEESYSEVEDS